MTKYIRKIYNLQFTIYNFLFAALLFSILHFTFYIPVYAITNPLAVPNNKFGIHIISASPDESSPAASLVNSTGGDWGYITVLIESKDRKVDKWQEFFNDLRRRHLIPLVRIATYPVGDVWKAPELAEAEEWAKFLNALNWPIKNRYVIIYNEPNHGAEWEGLADPKAYAQILDKTITTLKQYSDDFYVLNAGLDVSAPHQPGRYYDTVRFMSEMNQAVPGIFNKLDGWVSHSYPNPGFVGLPQGSGRGSARSWLWEKQLLSTLGVNKNLPVFITETGWKHAEGLKFDSSLPTSDNIATYLRIAYQDAWNDSNIVAVSPFLLTYQDEPFDHFSFKKLDSQGSGWYPQFEAVMQLHKIAGLPIQINQAELEAGEIYSSLVTGESYQIPFEFKNTGQSIWGDNNQIGLRSITNTNGLQIGQAVLEPDIQIPPGETGKFMLNLKTPGVGNFIVKLQLFNKGQPFDSRELEFKTEVKSPVILQIKSKLNWKTDFSGKYSLDIKSGVTTNGVSLQLNKLGESEPLEAKYLLPDYTFEFTLNKPFYEPKTIQVKVISGVNILDFGALQPDLFSALPYPRAFWSLLPFSN